MIAIRRVLAAAAIVALVATSARGVAHAGTDQVVVRFDAGVPRADAERMLSAIRAEIPATTAISDVGVEGAVCFVDVRRSLSGFIVRLAGASGRAFARDVTHEGEIGAAEAAAIVRAFVVAQLDAKPTPAAPTATPPPPPSVEPAPSSPAAPAASASSVPPAPTPPAPSAAPSTPPSLEARRPIPAERPVARATAAAAPWRARVFAAYTAATYASALPWQSGARLEGSWAFRPNVYLGLGYAFHPSTEVRTTAANVHLARHAAGAFAGLESSGQTLVFGADLGLALDATGQSTTRTAPGYAATDDASHVGPSFALRLHARWRVPDGNGLAFDVAPAGEIAPTERSLVLAGAESTTLLAPAVARFRLDVGATFDGF